MASLALLVSIVLLSILVSGPVVYILSCIRFIPDWIIWTIGIIVFLLGFHWMIMMPTWPINFLGFIPMLFCVWAINKRKKRSK
jgi:hypothetical protein